MTQMPTMQSVMQRQGVSLLLDGLTQPMAAYSLGRKLRSAYSGNAFKVRNASGVDLDIGFTADGLVDMSAYSTHVSGSAQATIRSIYDQSGNGRDLTFSATPNYDAFVRESSADITIGSNARLAIKRGAFNSYGQMVSSASWQLDNGATTRRWSILCVVAAGSSSYMEYNGAGGYTIYIGGDQAWYNDGSLRTIALGGTRSSAGVGFMARGGSGNNDWDASWNGGTYTDGSCSSTATEASGTKSFTMNDPLARFAEWIQWNVDINASQSTLVSNTKSFYGL